MAPPPSTTLTPLTVFTSLRYDPALLSCPANTAASDVSTPFYLLSHHRDRMLAAVSHFSFPAASTSILHSLDAFTQRLQEAVTTSGSGSDPLKLKVSLSRTGAFTVDITPTPAVPLSQLFPSSLPVAGDSDWDLVIDPQSTAKSSVTAYKTDSRDDYDSARARAGIDGWGEKREVVLWSEEEEVMEGSFTTVFLMRDNRWVTPADACGGQMGTSRRWALETGLATEGVVRRDEVKKGEWVVLSNGVRGFWGSRVV